MIEHIIVARTIDVPSSEVWAAIRAIGGLDRWFPVIDSCHVVGEGIGATRILGLAGGGEIRDRIEDIDDDAKRFRYLRTHHPFPVTSYNGTVLVRDDGNNGSEVTWTVEVDVAEAARDDVVAFLSAALADGIDGLGQDLKTNRRVS